MIERTKTLNKIKNHPEYDVIVIGGGASGIGAALESTLRGYRTLLLEQYDYTKGTSSKSTKLIHGGVRYLAQGDLKMVREALKERGYLLNNAPHLVNNQSFIIPNYRWWEGIFYTIGLTFYDLLAGKFSMGRSVHLGRSTVTEKLIGINGKGLRGGVLYHDGQFDDSRLAIDLLHALNEEGGHSVNYMSVTGLTKSEDGNVNGVIAYDTEGDETIRIKGKAILNTTGVWVDQILSMDNPEHEKTIRPSQGIHLVLNKDYLPGDHALMIPKTSDGRVLFAVPWHDHLVVGTTDTPVKETESEPQALEGEIEFILNTASTYLEKPVTRKDVLSVFAGLRPLAAPKDNSSKTKEISRNHKIIVSKSKLITIIGGKWTTYRKMGQDMVDRAIRIQLLPPAESKTKSFNISGRTFVPGSRYSSYGKHAAEIEEIGSENPELAENIHPVLPYTYAEVDWICRNESVIHLEDLLARRLRALLLNARAASEIADKVVERVGPILGWDKGKIDSEAKDFRELAGRYVLE